MPERNIMKKASKQNNLMLYSNRIYNKYKQSNQLIESPYAQEFSAHEIKIFEIAAALVNSDDLERVSFKSNKQYKFSAKQLSEMLDTSVSTISHEIEKTAIRIMKKTIHLRRVLDNGEVEFEAINIIPYAKYESGVLTFDFNYAIIPYIVQINKKFGFTEYQLHYVLSLKSAYAIKLYKLLYQFKNIKIRRFTVEDIKQQFGVANKYNQYNDFKKNILMPSILQINELTDLEVKYNEVKLGRKVLKLEFLFKRKDNVLTISEEPELTNFETGSKELITIISRIEKFISDNTKSIINEFYEIKGLEYIESSIQYAERNAKTNFDRYLQDTLRNNWAETIIKKNMAQKSAELKKINIENQKKTKKQLEQEQDQLNKLQIEHEWNQLSVDEQKQYNNFVNKVSKKYTDQLINFPIYKNSLTFCVFAVSTERSYDRIVEGYFQKLLTQSLNINEI